MRRERLGEGANHMGLRLVAEGEPSHMRDGAAWDHWLAIPSDARERILSNVWCGECMCTSMAGDWYVHTVRGDVLLEGSCARCGRQVRRLLTDR